MKIYEIQQEMCIQCQFSISPQAGTNAYFTMMFNIHKHISHLILLLVPGWGGYEIGEKNIIISRSISREQPYFSDRFHQ